MSHDVFILGCGRSGTSLIAGLFRASGYFQGSEFYRPRESNPLGFFEDREVNSINETLLQPLAPEMPAGTRWLARIPLGQTVASTPECERRIADVLASHPFCLKDPRFCYTIHLWRQQAPNAKMLCVFRNPHVVVASILEEISSVEYLKNVAVNADAAFEVWRMMYSHVVRQHALSGDWLFVEYKDLFHSTALDRIADFTGASIDRTFPRADLDRSDAISGGAPEINELYQELILRSRETLWR